MNYIAEQSDIKVFFAYRYFKTYQIGVNKDLSKKVRAIPLSLLSNGSLFHRINQKVRNHLIKRIIKSPFWVLQKICIYILFDYIILRKIIVQIKPDLIHVNNGGYPASFICQTAIFAAKHSGIDKIVYHINNVAEKPRNYIEKLIDKKINHHTNYFVTASRQANISLAQNRLFDNPKVVQIYNTIETPNIIKSRAEICILHNIDADKFILCEVAFLSQRKGQIFILNALLKIKKVHPDIFSQLVLFLVGDGEDYHKLKNYCEINGLQNVIFTGYQSNYIDYIACSDIFILPSMGGEDMPLAVLTAMNLKKPIISSNVAGIAEEIENHKSGILLETEKMENLYLEIVKLYKKDYLRNSYAENAHHRFNNLFSQPRIYNEFETLYSKLLGVT
ncbi:MAG: glycosyltransferase family 4 protein [Candidatus Atribacteria bacterium]|nr:glycosyltransferase family 4 protein [Candidatus Atribacteria bacterium]